MGLQQRTSLVPDWLLNTLAKGKDFKRLKIPIRKVACEGALRLRRFAIAVLSAYIRAGSIVMVVLCLKRWAAALGATPASVSHHP